MNPTMGASDLCSDVELIPEQLASNFGSVGVLLNESVHSARAVRMPDYFSSDCDFTLLHSFEPLTKYLYLVPLEFPSGEGGLHIHRSELTSMEVSSPGEKSLITPYGEIFVFGGQHSGTRIKKLAFASNELVDAGTMLYPRSEHCVSYCEGYIYIFNGENEPGRPLHQCERFNVRSGTCEEIAPSRLAVARASACTFNGKYIFRFGGVDSTKALVGAVERFDIRRNVWDVINPEFSLSLPASILTVHS